MKNKKKIKQSFAKIWAYSQNYHAAFLSAGILTVLATIFSLITPRYLGRFVDTIKDGMADGMNFDLLKQTAVMLIILYVLSQLFSFLPSWLTSTATQKLGQDLRDQLAAKICRLSAGDLNRQARGDILSRITNDVDTLSSSVSQVISLLANAALMFVGSLVMMLVTNIPLTIAAAVSGLLGVFLTGQISKKSMPYFMKQQRDLGQLDGYMEEIYQNQTLVKSFHQEDPTEEKFAGMNDALVHDGFLSQSLSGLMMPVSAFVSNLAYVLVCIAGGLLVLHGQGTFGMIVGFLVYVNDFTQPISRLSQSMAMLMSAAAAGDRVFGFLEEKEPEMETDQPDWHPEGKGNVVFDHVQFTYPDAEEPVIRDFSMHVKKGEKIAVVGPTGAGKTTLVNLLMRFYETDHGTITIDGMDTKKLSRHQVRSCFSMVLQDSWIFEGTLRENLILNKKNVPEEKLWQVMDAVGLRHFVETLPDGFDTVIRSDTALSQGQRQQIAIARAMLDDAPMLILDEASSSLDTRTEWRIQKAMDAMMEGRTSFVIAHRLSTIENADWILVLKDGQIVEQGTHEKLLKENGFYAQMYRNSSEQTAACTA